jgi:hypothetical protein
MTLTTTTIDYENDPIERADLPLHSVSLDAECPYCGGALPDHATDGGDETTHLHRTIGDTQVCRKLYECGNGSGDEPRLFYFYRDLDTANRFVTARVTETTSETIDDLPTIHFGRKKLRAEIKPKWRFRTKDATDRDFTEYFNENLVVGLEAEYDFKLRSIGGPTLARVFGVSDSAYHHTNGCPICGRGECWNHLPDNLIRAIESDASIEGWEFIIYAGKLSAEEFARRLPLAKIAQHFKPTWRNSLHTHAMLVHNIAKVPQVIIKNAWQLFRFYYPGWVYLFGNFPREQGFLRNQSADKDYVPFKLFNKSPFSDRWVNAVGTATHTTNGGGLYFGHFGEAGAARIAELSRPELTKFDLEIRTSDSTTDMEQFVGIRGFTKGMVVRAAQLSNFGLISVETNKETWEKVKAVTVKLNKRLSLTDEDEAFMKSQAIEFAKELAPFMSDYERVCVKHLIEKPVRTRTEQEQAHTFNVKTSPLCKDMRRLIALGEIEADTEDEWLRKVADLIESTPAEVTEAVHELKGYFDKEVRRVVLA